MSTTKISRSKRIRIFNRDNGECQVCHKKVKLESDKPFDKEVAQLDHINPRSLGGSNNDDNLRVLCCKCNGSRGNKTGEKLIQIVLNSLEIQFIKKFYIKVLNEISLGLIKETDIDRFEMKLQESHEENVKALKILRETIKNTR